MECALLCKTPGSRSGQSRLFITILVWLSEEIVSTALFTMKICICAGWTKWVRWHIHNRREKFLHVLLFHRPNRLESHAGIFSFDDCLMNCCYRIDVFVDEELISFSSSVQS